MSTSITSESIVVPDARRRRLLAAIATLEEREREPRVRLALAEAEFRLAVTPGTDPTEAIERIRRAITHDPFLPKLYLHLGRLLQRSGKYRPAVHEYRHAIRLAPSNRRAHLLLALALLELDDAEQALGRTLLEGVSRDSAEDLRTAVADLDALFRQQRSGGAAKSAKGKTPPRPVPTGKQSDDARSSGIWRLSLIEQLSRSKPIRRQIDAQLQTGAARAADEDGGVEYATACLLLLATGETVNQTRALMKTAGLDRRPPDAVSAVLDAALDLAAIEGPAAFVATAAGHAERGTLPPELVCWLHFSKFGPACALGADTVLRLLDDYPESFRRDGCFAELKLAVLDEYARAAWASERFDRAKLLWQEAAALDPYRVPLAINLALLATRTRSREDYASAWARVAELLYLHAAGAGDVQPLLEERRALHLVLSQQGRQRHCPASSAQDLPDRKQLVDWVADTDTFEIWLREWDLYYLNVRLSFRSPVHVLGVPRDASDEDVEAARDILLRHLGDALADRPWAGIAAFRDLAEDKIADAFERASDGVERARDPYYEVEKPDADALAEEALGRGILLRNVVLALVGRGRAADLRIGCAIARHEFTLPWLALKPICVGRGLIDERIDLVKLFEGDLAALASRCVDPEPRSPKDWSARLGALDECQALLPNSLDIRWLRCEALDGAERAEDAYAAAVEALELPIPDDDKDPDHTRILRAHLVTLIDNIALLQLPEPLRQPRNVETARRTLQEGRILLSHFPLSGALRAFLAEVLLQLGEKPHLDEAAELLREGRDTALDPDQRARFDEGLARALAAQMSRDRLDEVEMFVEPAMDRVEKAIASFKRAPSRTSSQLVRDAVTDAIVSVSTAIEVTETAELPHHQVSSLRSTLSKLRELEHKFSTYQEY